MHFKRRLVKDNIRSPEKLLPQVPVIYMDELQQITRISTEALEVCHYPEKVLFGEKISIQKWYTQDLTV